MALVKHPAAVYGRERYAAIASTAGPDLLLVALALMTWTNVWRVQDLLPFLAVVKLNLVATALAVTLFAIDRHPARRLAWLKTPILICALALLAIAVLGLPMSLWPRRSATFVVRDFVPNLLLAAMVAASVRGVRDLEWIALANLLGACVFSVFAQLNLAVTPDGRAENLIYYDANDLALVLVCTIPFAIFFFLDHRWAFRFLALGSLPLLLVTLAKTDSRGGLLGLVAVVAYVLLAYRAIPRRIRVLAVGVGIGVVSLLAGDAYWETIRTLREPERDYNWSGRSTEGRMAVWKRGLGYMTDDPVLGIGLRNFPLAEGMLSEESKARAERGAGFKWSVAHNSFLEIGVELGLTGLVMFVAMLAAALRTLARVRSANPLGDRVVRRAVAFACTTSASFVGFVVCGFFISAGYFSYLYLLLGLTVGLDKLYRFGPLLPSLWSRRDSPLSASMFQQRPPRARDAADSRLGLPRPQPARRRFERPLT